MRHNVCHLPNGQLISVSPVFGGLTFRINDAHLGRSLLPPGWTIVLYTRQHTQEKGKSDGAQDGAREAGGKSDDQSHSSRFTAPTLQDDCLYLSAIVSPPNNEHKLATSASRQIAMMLWVTLWWYFHEPEPDLHLETEASSRTPVAGRPKGEWRVNIKREGIFKGRNVLQKLERMGLIATEDSSVGPDAFDNESWEAMFVSRRSFWQIDPRLFVFSLSPLNIGQNVPGSSHHTRQLSSPTRETMYLADSGPPPSDTGHYAPNEGPFASSTNLPTFYPPPATQYIFTNGVRHPIRPKPPHQGDVFYIRYIPSVGQYLSFRVPYLPSQKTQGPGGAPSKAHTSSASTSDPVVSNTPSDLDYLHKWMNDPRVSAAWGEAGPISHQEEFLRNNLKSRHSFPVIGCWDGKPFGYFEIYWVKEDRLGQLIGGAAITTGESTCWSESRNQRTETVMLEPRVDNTKVLEYLQKAGFYKEGEVSFPHKQSNLMKIKRDSWEAPAI
ncbi:siderophore biosynthesis protein [Aspergillus nomiae NRRL 13137]|uniref:Siderophore biosynthesis protein n=1 Tax=Aspergillus nomiae NRRL (strain ATCC 15546 / NRRL 13137 / CBS 260.88 / M93) TaxID=1509407 RepID=A0A0L1J894_ASPN3|nr:siderophore biosynthesis protein [Aspergillus nomiae NRRL 13137]KNG87954.1 siderophore biosynthesis protein [Aspergillus nomiae NRRL 13137]